MNILEFFFWFSGGSVTPSSGPTAIRFTAETVQSATLSGETLSAGSVQGEVVSSASFERESCV